MVGSNLKDTQLQHVVDKTISFEEFAEAVWNTDVPKKMVVEV